MNRTRTLTHAAAFVLPLVLIAGCLQGSPTADGGEAGASAAPAVDQQTQAAAQTAPTEAAPDRNATPVIVTAPPVRSVEVVAAPPEASPPAQPPVQTVETIETIEIRPVAVDPEPTPGAPVFAIQAVPSPSLDDCHPGSGQLLRPLDELCFGGDTAP